VYGSYALLLPEHPQIYAFTRSLDSERLLVILNFSAETPVFTLPADILFVSKDLLIANYPVDPADEIRQFTLRPYEARVYRLPIPSEG
jgi:oligo-1,6-glucosidase